MEIILIIVIIVLCVLLGFVINQDRKERANLVNAIIAKNAYEKSALDIADKVKPTKEEKPDLIPIEDLTDEEFEKYAQT